MSVTPTPSCADARSDDNAASENMSRETKPTKVRETTHRFGIAEPSISILLKVSFCKTLLLTCSQQCSRVQFLITLLAGANTRSGIKPEFTVTEKIDLYSARQQKAVGIPNGTRSRYTTVKSPVKMIAPHQSPTLGHPPTILDSLLRRISAKSNLSTPRYAIITRVHGSG